MTPPSSFEFFLVFPTGLSGSLRGNVVKSPNVGRKISLLDPVLSFIVSHEGYHSRQNLKAYGCRDHVCVKAHI